MGFILSAMEAYLWSSLACFMLVFKPDCGIILCVAVEHTALESDCSDGSSGFVS